MTTRATPLDLNMIDVTDLRDIAPLVTDEHGRLMVVPASVYEATTPAERSVFCVRHGVYGLPTTELVDLLRALINGRTAIEIGAGTGVLAAALGIPATDSFQQQRPEIKAYYDALQQPIVPYGDSVERLDAAEAIAKYKPQVVIGSWVTHRYKPTRHSAGGNVDGIDEEHVVANCETYIVIGNVQVHRGKSIWARDHMQMSPPFLYSRAYNGSPEFIAAWSKTI